MIDQDRIIETELQEIIIDKKEFNGIMLDVGGGGEGIIGKVYGKKAVSIDKLENELDETQNEAVKMVMDACSLNFEDDSFDAAAFFYSLMYMTVDDKQKALSEAARVLKSDGFIEIWDSIVPEYNGGKKDVFIAHISAEILGETIKTSYGVGMEGKQQTPENIEKILIDIGLSIAEKKLTKDAFYIKAVK